MVPSRRSRLPRPAGTAANTDWVCVAVQSGSQEATGRAPLGREATDAAGAYRPYDVDAPLAPGGVCARLGSTW